MSAGEGRDRPGDGVSRLARNNADWYQLLDLCALTDTLIADADGVYHPGDFNDRLVLGLKGTMSEALCRYPDKLSYADFPVMPTRRLECSAARGYGQERSA